MAHILQDSNTNKQTALTDVLVPISNEACVPNGNRGATSLKIGDIKVNVRSSFHPDKSLYDALFMIASTRLKEMPA